MNSQFWFVASLPISRSLLAVVRAKLNVKFQVARLGMSDHKAIDGSGNPDGDNWRQYVRSFGKK